MSWQEENKNITRPPFRYNGGHYFIANKLINYVPDHRIYVEPFAGSGAMFWRKRLAEVNVLNDLNKDVMSLYRAVKYHKLNSCNFRRDKQRVCNLFYEYNVKMKTDKGIKKDINALINKIKHLDEYAGKLKNVKLYNRDYKEIVEAYDSPETFFYFDPPWKGHNVSKGYDYSDEYFDYDEFFDILTELQGMFMFVHSLDEDIYNFYKHNKSVLKLYKIYKFDSSKLFTINKVNHETMYSEIFVMLNYGV